MALWQLKLIVGVCCVAWGFKSWCGHCLQNYFSVTCANKSEKYTQRNGYVKIEPRKFYVKITYILCKLYRPYTNCVKFTQILCKIFT